MVLYGTICYNFWHQLDDLEKEISKRYPTMSPLEAKLFYDDLQSIYNKMTAFETEAEKAVTESTTLKNMQHNYRLARLKALNLKIKLTKMLSSNESTQQSEIAKNSDSSWIRKQNFLIRQIESLEIKDDTCAIEAGVIYSHLSQLYDSFISNQIEIEANLDDGDFSDNQRKIAKEIQQKVIDLQTKLKKISSTTRSQVYQSEELKSSESESDLRAMAYQLANFIVSSHNTPESQSDETASNTSNVSTSLEHHLEISKDIQNKIICLEEKLHRENDTLDRLVKIQNVVDDWEKRGKDTQERLDNIEGILDEHEKQGKDTLQRLNNFKGFVGECENRLDNIEVSVCRLDNVESLERRLDNAESFIDNCEIRLDNNERSLRRVDNIEGFVDECEIRLGAIEGSVGKLDNIEVCVERCETRLDYIEGLVGKCEKQGKSASERLDNIEGEMDERGKERNDALDRLDNIEASVQECEGRLDTVERSTEDFEDRLLDCENKVENFEDSVTDLEDKLNNFEGLEEECQDRYNEINERLDTIDGVLDDLQN